MILFALKQSLAAAAGCVKPMRGIRLAAKSEYPVLHTVLPGVDQRRFEVSFWGLPSPFKMVWRGIIYLKGKEPGNWIKCFYNKDQAMKATKLAEGSWKKNTNG